MQGISAKYKYFFSQRTNILSLLTGLFILLAAIIINIFAGIYATEIASSSVTDVFLSTFPAVKVDIFFVYGPIIFWSIATLYCLRDPSRLPFALKSIGLFIIIRSAFISLTHIGPFPDAISITSLSASTNYFIFNSGADLFFSAHTGMPFLMALTFWPNKIMRYISLFASVFFGIIVLLGHLHYSIDVLSAFFITYSIYHIARVFWKEDYARFLGSYSYSHIEDNETTIA